jgi:hypothetical protein
MEENHMNNKLISPVKLRRRVLARAAELRPFWLYTRVSPTMAEYMERKLEEHIDNVIKSQPSSGRTIREP